MELDEFRGCFPVLDRLVWLSTPSGAPAAASVSRALLDEVGGWMRGDASWVDRDQAAQRTRDQVAALLAVPVADVALMQSVAEAASTVAGGLVPGDTVVVGEQEYRSNLFPWLAAQRRGVRVRHVPMPRGCLLSEDLVAAIDDATTLVAVSDVQSATGSRVDLAVVAERCRQVGARLFVDATQSAGVLALPAGVDADYLAVHGYKWLLCPRGSAWLYVRPDRLEALQPLAPNPKVTAEPWRDFYGGPLDYAPDARKLDMSLCWPAWAGAAAALDLMAGVDRSALERHCLSLAASLRVGATEQGLHCLPTERPTHIVAVAVPEPASALSYLHAQGVRATARAGALRFGFHGFNTPEDVDRVLTALRRRTA